MPMTKNISHLQHEAVTKHTWAPNNDTVRYQASGSSAYKADMFTYGDTSDTPHISEHNYQLNDPQEWADRISSMTIVHTGGGTNMAMYTHHTTTRPRLPPGSLMLEGGFTLSRYLPKEDAAVEELHLVAEKVRPALPVLMPALDTYHLHSPDGWIKTGGFLSCCTKVGLSLLRSEFLALERSVPKDTLGRINYIHVKQVVEAICEANAAEDLMSTAPEAVLKMTAGRS